MVNNKTAIKLVAIIFCLLGFASFLTAQTMNDGSRYAENSVLASGKWIQLKIKDNGIYKLTYDDIKKQGISDPSKVKIYGYGGWILPEDFSQPYIDDLPEVAVYMDKGSDGVFSSGDYLLFYGHGTTKWTYNPSNDAYEHENNPYSTYGSYFMTESDTGPKEMETVPVASIPSGTVNLSVFDDYAVYERDSISILNSGRELFGESFVANSGKQSFIFTVPGITSDPGKARLSFAAAPISAPTPVNLAIDGQSISTMSIAVPADFYTKANLVERWDNWIGDKTEKVTATVTYNSAGQSVANLNFIALNMKRSLQFYPVAYTFFRNKGCLSSAVTYSIGSPPASCQIWDVTPTNDTRLMATALNNGRLEFSAPSSATLQEFAMVDLSKNFPTPEFAGPVPNQNLHSLPQVDMVILAPTVFLQQAQTLADKHTQQSGLQVAVVDDRLVFNEFSSGTPDATAYRRFMKMFYDRATSDADKPKYLLLFGDGLFDNRHLTSAGAKVDAKYYLLTYQVKGSVNETVSYGTDDYFGFLDDNEGKNIVSATLDIGIGRFPVSSVTQAVNAVDKVTSYMDNKQYGNWKSKLVFSADNTDTPPAGVAVHASQADQLATYMEQNFPQYLLKKIYIDAYQLVNTNGKLTAPAAKDDLLAQIQKDGCFLVNYTGHGNTTSWSAEDLLNITDIRQMKNDCLPLWITATCDFGWFDGFDTSGGEAAFLSTTGGAIALFTTSRVVNSSSNFTLNNQFIRYLFNKSDGNYLRLGDIFRLSKNKTGSDDNKLNYVLLGDPALMLNYPQWNIRLDSINGNPIPDTEALELRANDRATFSGVIVDESGTPVENFSGKLNASVFDSQQTYQALTGTNSNGTPFSYQSYPGMVYSGNTDINNGTFSFTFNVPKDISYSTTNGKIGMYAYDATQGNDAAGSFTQYYLSGTNDDYIDSGEGPVIESMFLNTENFRNGDPVNETPFFYAKVSDVNGINFSGSGIGHSISLRIDNTWIYSNLNDNYEAINDTLGTVGFSIPELPAGKHTLLFKVWNILNYSTTDTLNFTVVKGYKPTIVDLQANGNPARTVTYFQLIHNLPETQLNVEVGVYDLTGRTVWIHSETGSSGFLENYPIQWDLINSAGSRVQPGVYVYRATIRTAYSTETTKAKKIIVLGQ